MTHVICSTWKRTSTLVPLAFMTMFSFVVSLEFYLFGFRPTIIYAKNVKTFHNNDMVEV